MLHSRLLVHVKLVDLKPAERLLVSYPVVNFGTYLVKGNTKALASIEPRIKLSRKSVLGRTSLVAMQSCLCAQLLWEL